jgi:hypothetical protein
MFARFAHAPRVARLALALTAAATLAAPVRAGFTPFTMGGNTSPASILPTVDSFRAAIGGVNNGNAAGPLGSGRREINWDGGGAVTATVTAGTLSGFTNTRGGTFTTPGTGFLQTPLTDVALTGINAAYSTTFVAFSAQRIFTPTGSNVTEVKFSVPGTNGATPATVSAFGAVFSDVDLASTTKIELYDLSDALLLLLNVPQGSPGATAPNGSLSFAGAQATAGEQIARVVITTGNQALALADSNGNPVDVVVMDDFIYSEPVGVPEPTAAALGLAAMFAVRATTRRRRRA